MLTSIRRPSRVALIAAVAAALLAPGCGGDSEEDKAKEYREGLAEADKKFDQELREAGAAMQAAGQAKSREQYAQGVEQLQTAVDEFKADLDELDTPSDAENEQEAVTEAVDEFSAAVGSINEAVQADDEAQIRTEVAAVQTSGVEVDQAIETLKKAVD